MEGKPIGVIGGSGLYKLEGIEILDEVEIHTPWGNPSDRYVKARLGNRILYFLPRHGRHHSFPPHRVNYRANIWGFRELGVERIVGISAVGGITKKPGDIIVPNDFLDFSKDTTTFYEGTSLDVDDDGSRVAKALRKGSIVHIDLSQPFCPQTRTFILEASKRVGIDVYPIGVYAMMGGPRLETPSEIRFLRLAGADVVGMTMVKEVVLARELEMCYVGINVVTNYAAGISETKLTTHEVVETMNENLRKVQSIILKALELWEDDRSCPCKEALEGTVMS